MSFYVDTSVIVAAVGKETETVASQHWLARQPSRSLFISDWVETEFASAYALKLRHGDVTDDQRQLAASVFSRLVARSLISVAIERRHFRAAARFAGVEHFGLRAADALHVAICFDRGLGLCTLDRRMAEAGTTLGLVVEMP